MVFQKGLSFYEFVRWSAECFQEQASIEWADAWFKEIPNMKHEGDCTKECFTCNLCLLEGLLSEYHDYVFNYDKFVKENIEDSISIGYTSPQTYTANNLTTDVNL